MPNPTTPAGSSVFERTTIEHVANAAGVSVATVSRALRGLPNVAVPTRARVEQVARELSYRADPAASRLAAGRSRTIAVVVPLINSWYFSNVVAGAEAVCAEEGYDLLVLTAPNTTARHDVVTASAAMHRRVDGLIFVEVSLGRDELDELARRGLGVVTVGQETALFSSVHVDNVAVGRTATDHLVDLGHRRIGILGAQVEEPAFFDVPGQRIRGAEQSLAAAGRALDPDLVRTGEFTVEGGHRAGLELLARSDRPTAIFALSDEMAFGAVMAARDLDLAIPGDVSLVGVDDHEMAVVVGLTTVRQRVVEHGALAARALLRRLAGDADAIEHLPSEPELVERSSTRTAALLVGRVRRDLTMLAVDGKWIWDSWYVDLGDEYHVFYLQAPRSLGDPDLRHVNASIGHARSTDLRTWTLLPDALAPGAPGSFDETATWTGCVVPNDEGWTMYYTGLATGRTQRIGIAQSRDLITWRKHPDNPALESDGSWYEPTAGDGHSQPAWRDPWVYRGDDGYHMLITARAPHGASRTRGIIARASSQDGLRWEVEPPLTTASSFAELEVPQLIEIMGRTVLIFSCGPEGRSPRRPPEQAGGDCYYLLIDDDPTSSEQAVALDLPGLYACRVVWDRAGEPNVIGFVNHDVESGAFVGALSDPIPLRIAAPALFR